MNAHSFKMLEEVEADRLEWRKEALRLRTALQRIVSLEEKNVPKYAQQIAKEALTAPLQNGKTGQ